MPAVAGQQHQRQHHDRVGDRGADQEEVRLGEEERQHGDAEQQHTAGAARPAQRRHRRGDQALDLADPQWGLRHQDDDREEEQGGHHRAQAADVDAEERSLAGEVADDVGLHDAQPHRAGEGERQTLEPAQHGRGVGVDHQQGEVVVLQADRGSQHDAAESGQRGADRPGESGHDVGAAAVQLEQVGVVHRGPHRRADPGAVQEQVERTRDHAREQDRDDLVRRHVGAEDLEPAAGEERRDGPHLRRPDLLGDTDQRDQQTHRDDEDHPHRRLAQPAGQEALDEDAQRRRDHQQHEEQRDRVRQGLTLGEVPVHERQQHPEGTVRDVEHPGGAVGQHQARGRDGVRRTGEDTGQGVGDEGVHDDPLSSGRVRPGWCRSTGRCCRSSGSTCRP